MRLIQLVRAHLGLIAGARIVRLVEQKTMGTLTRCEWPNRLLVVEPWSRTDYREDSDFSFGLKCWGVHALYVDVTQDWIDAILTSWSVCEPISVSFWYRGGWRTGNGFIINAAISAGVRNTALTLQLSVEGTGFLR